MDTIKHLLDSLGGHSRVEFGVNNGLYWCMIDRAAYAESKHTPHEALRNARVAYHEANRKKAQA